MKTNVGLGAALHSLQRDVTGEQGSRGQAKGAEGLLASSQRYPVHHGKGLLLTGFLVLCSFSKGSVLM